MRERGEREEERRCQERDKRGREEGKRDEERVRERTKGGYYVH